MKASLKVLFVFAAVVVLGLVPLAAAQGEVEPAVTSEIVLAILGASIFGIPFSGLVEIVKRVLMRIFPTAGEKKWFGYVTTGIVIAALDVVTLIGFSIFTVENALVAWVIAFAVANGFYKITVKAAEDKISRING